MKHDMLSIKPSWKHASLEHQIKELDTSQEMSRSAITCRAIAFAREVSDWSHIKEKLSGIPKLDIEVPGSMQARLDEESTEALEDIIRPRILEDLTDLKILQNQYLLQLVWQNYLGVLQSKVLAVGAEEKIESENVTGPDMVKLLVEMILLNRETDAKSINQIKNILIDWRNNR